MYEIFPTTFVLWTVKIQDQILFPLTYLNLSLSMRNADGAVAAGIGGYMFDQQRSLLLLLLKEAN